MNAYIKHATWKALEWTCDGSPRAWLHDLEQVVYCSRPWSLIRNGLLDSVICGASYDFSQLLLKIPLLSSWI